MKNDLLTFATWRSERVAAVLQLALAMKAEPTQYRQALAGKSLVALFEKPSLRTRLSFDIGIQNLGGHFIYLDLHANQLENRESLGDTAANIGCWADALIARVFSHNTLEVYSQSCNIPVINALCDRYHPCQALADMLTLAETFGNLREVKLAYIGDGNNVAHSLMITAAQLGLKLTVITPEGYDTAACVLDDALRLAVSTGAEISTSNDLDAAIGVNVVYTDTWISMGSTESSEAKQAIFAPYQINAALLRKTGASCVMHCQPAHRDVEITSDVIDSECSLLMLQATNRMYAQNAILVHLLGHGDNPTSAAK